MEEPSSLHCLTMVDTMVDSVIAYFGLDRYLMNGNIICILVYLLL